jgi:hypothetical protein
VYYRIGAMEYRRGFPLAAASVLLWLLTSFWLGCTFFVNLGAQVGIFVVLTLVSVFRKPKPGRRIV